MADAKKKVTIYDVAELANVTIATVSRVINGKDNVASETKKRVMKAIEKLNYYPSPIASGLSKSKSQEVGILVPFFFGEFFLRLLEGITQGMEGYELILYNASTPNIKKNLISRIVGENKIDGLFVVSLPILMDEEIQLQKANFPLVILDNKHSAYSTVSFDNVFGAFHAVERLIELGHKRIALITGAAEDPFHLTVAKDRTKGYKMALNMAGIPIDDELIQINDWSRHGANHLTKKLLKLKNPPTAIFSISDVQAVGVLDAARELGLNVPEDLSVIGYDNLEFADFLGLTTVSQPLNYASQLGSTMLLNQIESERTNNESVVLQPSLVERKTIAPPKKN